MASSHQKNPRQKRDVAEVMITSLSSALEEIQRLNKSGLSDCFSTKDIYEQLGGNTADIRKIIRICIDNGTCEYAGKRCEMGIDGRVIKVPTYRFEFKNKNKNRKKK